MPSQKKEAFGSSTFRGRGVAFRLVATYLLIGSAWILFSDHALELLAPDPRVYAQLQTLKGWFYVAVTSILFGFFAYAGFRRNAELRSREEEGEWRYRTIVETTSEGVWTLGPDDAVSYANPAGCAMLGLGVRDVIGKNIREFLHGSEEGSAHAEFENGLSGLREGRPVKVEAEMERADGSGLWCAVALNPRFSSEGSFAGSQALVSDIQTHRDFKLRIDAMLAEKDSLLRELHHRVKNNLQLISSLISLRLEQTPDNEARRYFTEFLLRIRTISVAHEKLYVLSETSRLDLAELIRDVINEQSAFFGKHPTIFRHDRENPAAIDFELGVPISLALNESLLNSQMHAFPDGRAGGIEVELRKTAENIEIEVRDDGVGFDPEKVPADSVGFSLIRILVAQAGGTVVIRSPIDGNGGAETRISLPLRRSYSAAGPKESPE